MNQSYSLREVATAIGAELLGEDCQFSSVSSDSRKITASCLFIALEGERFDGHKFMKDAVDLGAAALCINRKHADSCRDLGASALLVDDTLAALCAVATWYRTKLQGKVVAVSGSVGKTSTRDMIFAALSSRNVSKTQANLNNCIGVSHTVLDCAEDCATLVLELGIGEPGEMRLLTSIAAPDVAVITMIGFSHIAFFGSRSALTAEKLELAEELQQGGVLLLNGDDSELQQALNAEYLQNLIVRKQLRVILSRIDEGLQTSDELQALWQNYPCLCASELSFGEDSSNFNLRWERPELLDFRPEACAFSLQLERYGRHMVQNAIFAVIVAQLYGYEQSEISRNVLSFEQTGARQKRMDGRRFTLIDDSYNASAESMAAALDYLVSLAAFTGRRSVAALGCINELGDFAEEIHRDIGLSIARYAPDYVFLCGPYAELMADCCRSEQERSGSKFSKLELFADSNELSASLLPQLREHDILLVKASHSFALDKVGQAAWAYMEES